MFERFTDGASRVVVLAQEESRLLNHDRIGTEHLLLGLLHDTDTDTARALVRAGVSLVIVQQRLEQSHCRGKEGPSGHIPFTPRAKKVLELALRVSQRLGDDTIGSPHLLQAMLDVRDGTGYELLVGLGVDIEELMRVAEDLARSGADTRSDEGAAVRVVRRSASGATFAAAATVARRMSAHEISSGVGSLADELAQRHDRLAAGLRHYGRHLESCKPDSEHGCTCGFDLLLADANPPTGGDDPGTG
ncbi:MAG: hypothetical protein M3N95_12320 [Actinomycetota bacterium]|nr:hypothetical protein [Actinomycetota bacterium]